MNKQKQKKYEREMLQMVKAYEFVRFDHVFNGAVSFSRATAYNHGLDKLDSIKEALAQNRAKAVNYLLQKWVQSDNPTLQIAAMRLVADSEDHQRLNQQYIDHSNKGEKFEEQKINIAIDSEKINLKT